MIRVLLIAPGDEELPQDYRDVPLSLAYLASYLIKKKGKDLQVYGADLNSEKSDNLYNLVLQNVQDYQPDVVGITSNTSNYYRALQVASIIKKINPECLTVLGGCHVTLDKAHLSIAALRNIDCCVYGEGEQTFFEIIDSVEKGHDIYKLKGLIYVRNEKIIINEPRPLIVDIDSIPIPERSMFSVNEYPLLRVITSRGCRNSCLFCCSCKIWNMTQRFHSPKRVVEEIEIISKYYKREQVFIADDNFLTNKERISEICDRLSKNKENRQLYCLTRIDDVSATLLKKLRDVGLKSISIGCESGDDAVLKKVGKRIKSAQIGEAVRQIKRLGIHTRTSWIWGFPFDNRKTMQRTIHCIKEAAPDEVILYRFIPYPGTQYYVGKNPLELKKYKTGTKEFLCKNKHLDFVEMNEIFAQAIIELCKADYMYVENYTNESDSRKVISDGFTQLATFLMTNHKEK